MNLTRTAIAAAFFFGLVIAAGGCGESGPARYRVSGKITHGGQPIPAGSITFIPDTSKGNSGPAASVKIKNGQYDSEVDGMGHVGGPHLVKITGLDGQGSDEFSEGTMLFPDYEMNLDLPKQKSTQDLDVPADWVMPPQQPAAAEGP